jgi:hypothetical protein
MPARGRSRICTTRAGSGRSESTGAWRRNRPAGSSFDVFGLRGQAPSHLTTARRLPGGYEIPLLQ